MDSYRELNADPGADNDSKRLARERVSKFYTAMGQSEKLNKLLQKGGGSQRQPDRAAQRPTTAPRRAADGRSHGLIAVTTRALGYRHLGSLEI